MSNSKTSKAEDQPQPDSLDRTLSAACWTELSRASGGLDIFAIAELVPSTYAVTFVAASAVIGDADRDRYMSLEIDGAALVATLWTHAGGRRGQRVGFQLTAYDNASGVDDLSEELGLLLSRWHVAPRTRRRPTPLPPDTRAA